MQVISKRCRGKGKARATLPPATEHGIMRGGGGVNVIFGSATFFDSYKHKLERWERTNAWNYFTELDTTVKCELL